MATASTNTRKKQATTVVVGANDMGKKPPQSIEVEEAVLGAIMIDKDAYSIISDMLRPSSFYKKEHELIYQAITDLATKEAPIDLLTVSQALKENGTLEQAGGLMYLSGLTRKVASSAHLYHHASIVAKASTARDIISVAAQVVERGYDETYDVEQLLDEATAGFFEISQRQQKRDVMQVDPVIKEAIDRMVKASKNEGNISGVPSGFRDLDKITGGWQKSDLVIIAARPAMGKTAFVLSMAKNMAVNFHRACAVFSLEMSNVQLVNRLIMNVCEIEGEKIKSGKLSKPEWNQLEHRITELQGAPIYLDDTPSLSVFELQSKARKLVKEKGVEVIIIDYLQLMNANGMNFGSREQEVSIISRSLKGLAKELDIPIIALSQLNRGVESRTGVEGKKPQLSDLRESGAIEQDADMVCFIHRPEYYHIYDDGNGHDLRGKGQIIVAKHRNGATDEVTLRFRGKYAKFQNLDESVDDDELYRGPSQSASYVADSAPHIESRMNQMDADGASLDDNNDLPPF